MSYRSEQVLTAAVVREFLTRTQYRVVPREDADADATLHGNITTVRLAPLAFSSQTGNASTALVEVVLNVSLVDRKGKTLYSNPGYVFREQYELSQDPTTFFQEEGPALDRLSRDFARTLVSNILETY